jgi:hypothetical protein
MSVYFLLTILTSISKAGPKIMPVANDVFVTVNDFNQIKVAVLAFVVLQLLGFVKWVFGIFFGDNRTLSEKVNSLETNDALIIQKLENIEKYYANLKDSQISEGEIRNLIRDEASYAEKLKRRN